MFNIFLLIILSWSCLTNLLYCERYQLEFSFIKTLLPILLKKFQIPHKYCNEFRSCKLAMQTSKSLQSIQTSCTQSGKRIFYLGEIQAIPFIHHTVSILLQGPMFLVCAIELYLFVYVLQNYINTFKFEINCTKLLHHRVCITSIMKKNYAAFCFLN